MPAPTMAMRFIEDKQAVSVLTLVAAGWIVRWFAPGSVRSWAGHVDTDRADRCTHRCTRAFPNALTAKDNAISWQSSAGLHRVP